METPLEFYSRRYREGDERWSQVATGLKLDAVLVERLRELFNENPSLRLLDVGCGRLHLLTRLRKLFPGMQLVGIDFAYDAIVESSPALTGTARDAKIVFRKEDVFRFVADTPFDVVVDIGLFHHVVPELWCSYVASVSSLLATSGRYFVRSFHPSDQNWGQQETGGHYRKGYYCHYHSLASLRTLWQGTLTGGRELAREPREEHVESLYEFGR